MGIQTAPGYIALNSDGVTPYQHPVELDRNQLKALYRQSGALRAGDWAVAPTATNQQVSISTGAGFVLGQESAQQGGYFAWSDASENKTFGAPSGSPRIDTLLLRIYDSQYGTLPSGTGRAQWDIVAGTPGATPAPQPDSAFISTGGQWVPGAWMKWAEVRINPGDTVIPSGQIYLPGSVVSGTGTTWSQRYTRQSAGTILCTSTSRPSAPATGDQIYEVDTRTQKVWTGAAWDILADANVWTSFATSGLLVAVGGGVTQGNSSYIARYKQIGKTVTIAVQIVIGSTFVAGSGIYSIVLPIAAHSSLLGAGSCNLVDNTTAIYNFTAKAFDTTHLRLYKNGALTALDASGPGTTWATNDSIDLTYTYEVP